MTTQEFCKKYKLTEDFLMLIDRNAKIPKWSEITWSRQNIEELFAIPVGFQVKIRTQYLNELRETTYTVTIDMFSKGSSITIRSCSFPATTERGNTHFNIMGPEELKTALAGNVIERKMNCNVA